MKSLTTFENTLKEKIDPLMSISYKQSNTTKKELSCLTLVVSMY